MTRERKSVVEAMLMVLFFVFIGAAEPAAGQTTTDDRVWTAVSVQGRLGTDSPWRWTSESLVRARDGASRLDLLAEQVMVTRNLTRQSGVGIGYAYLRGFPDAGSLREHRFVQQYTLSRGVNLRASLRSRIEERFVTGHQAMLLRVRQQVRVTWPLAARGGLQGVASDELYVKAGSTALTSPGLDSNHVFMGVRRRMTARSAMEIGYLNVYSQMGPNRHLRSHVMLATLAVGL
jgi:Protein of unknown function (DUF2490)